MKKTLPLFLCCVFHWAIAQVQYEPGYFIDNNSTRVECLIRNEGWFRSPAKFLYKLSDAAEKQEGKIASTREFGVGGLRYIRETVDVDTSSQDLKRLSVNSAPEWDSRTIFLQLLVDGPAKLYRYRTRELQLFFYSVNASQVEQLVYKRYTVSMTQLGETFSFRAQMRGSVACNDAAKIKAGDLKYQVDELSEFFEEFNKCKGYEQPVAAEGNKQWESKFHMAITPGYDVGSIARVSDDGRHDNTPQSDPGYRLGVMFEFVFPFARNKWSFMVEPTFQSSFNASALDFHRSFEVPIAIRHSFYVGDNAAVFVNAMMVADFFGIYRCKNDYQINIKSTLYKEPVAGCGAAGVGFRWNNLSFETRYYFNRRVTAENLLNLNDFSKLSLILGVRIL